MFERDSDGGAGPPARPDAQALQEAEVIPSSAQPRAHPGRPADPPTMVEALARMAAAEDTLRAIGAGEVDAFVVGPVEAESDQRVFSLASADRPYRIFVENMRDGAATVSDAGIIMYANRRLAELIAAPRSSIVGTPLAAYLTGLGTAELLRQLSQHPPPGGIVDVTLLDRNGLALPVLVGLSPLVVDGESLTCVTFTDLTQVTMQKQEISRLVHQRAMQVSDVRNEFAVSLAHTQKLEALGLLASGIAHDFNNLLGVILGNTELLLRSLPAESPDHELASEISLAAKRSADLARQLLTYAGKGERLVETVALNDIVDGLAALITSAISKTIVVSLALDHDTPTVEGNTTQLSQVVLNLLTNASDAIGDDAGTITVRTDLVVVDAAGLPDYESSSDLAAGPYARLEVADSGSGMDEETQAKIFDAFFTTKTSGRGLGLAVIQGIVHQHGGAMKVASTLGQGTVFTILLPASTTRVQAAAGLAS